MVGRRREMLVSLDLEYSLLRGRRFLRTANLDEGISDDFRIELLKYKQTTSCGNFKARQ